MKKLLSLSLALILILGVACSVPAVSAAEVEKTVGYSSGTTGDCTWTLSDDGVLTISGNGAMEDYDENWYSSYAPWGTGVKKVIIENGVTGIGSEAFAYCSLLTDVTIPDSVTSFGSRAFENCSSLTDFIVPDSITNIGWAAFCGCTSLSSISIGSGVERILDFTFEDCENLIKIAIPDNVTYLGEEVFRYCPDITIYGVEGSYAHSFATEYFYNFKPISEYESNTPSTQDEPTVKSGTTGDCTWTLDDNGVLTVSGSGAMGDYEESDRAPWGKEITGLVIENGVTSIGEYAFYHCEKLTDITIPASVTSIGGAAFEFCYGLKNVTFNKGLETIGWLAFGDCNKLTELTLPDGLKSIDNSAFEYCTGLKKITVPESVTYFGGAVFSMCSSLAEINIPSGVWAICPFTFSNCGLKKVYLPEGLKAVNMGAFMRCNALTDVYYAGSAADWQKIQIDAQNDSLKNATKHYAKATPVTSVKLNKTSISLSVGQKSTITATIAPTYATNKTVKWTTSNSKVATVDAKGNVVAKGAGTAVITATSNNGKKATCKVTVIQPATGVKLNYTSVTANVGKKFTLKATVTPSNAYNKTVKWSTSNSKVAAIDSKGNVTAKGAGTATITCATTNGKKVYCKVKVNAVAATSVKLNYKNVATKKGKVFTLKATISPTNTTNKTVKWTSSNSKIASVDKYGRVKGIKKGTVTITCATTNGKKAYCKVTVK